MSAESKPFNSRITGSFDIGTGYGALGDCVKINNIVDNFSIDPNNNLVGLTKLFSAYIIQTNLVVNMSLPPLSELSYGWNSKIYFSSTSGKVTFWIQSAQ